MGYRWGRISRDVVLLVVGTAMVCMWLRSYMDRHVYRLPLSNSVHQLNKVRRHGCGKTRLCLESRTLFTSLFHNTRWSPSSLDITLSGLSTGYIAVGLTAMASEIPAVVFVCGRNSERNNGFFFVTKLSDREGNLAPWRTEVNEIRGTVEGNLISCEFSIPIDDMDNMLMDTTVHVILGSGTASGKRLGIMKTHLDTGEIDVTDPTAA